MAQEQSHQFDHSLVDEHKYNNLQHPADCGRFVCMLQEYVKHLKSLRAVNRLEQETAERSVNMLDNDIAWSIAVHSVDEFQEYDGPQSGSELLNWVLGQLQHRRRRHVATPLTESDQWQEALLWRKITAIVECLKWGWTGMDDLKQQRDTDQDGDMQVQELLSDLDL